MSTETCPGPLIWFDVEATANETQAAVLECSTCGYIIASGWFHDEKAGVMRDHRGDLFVGGWRQQCAGVGEPPKALVEDPVAAMRRELEAARPVVEAAGAYFDEYGWLLAVDRDNLDAMPRLADDPRFKLLAAVDLYRSATSDHPSTTEEKP